MGKICTLYCGDCVEVLADFPKDYVDLTVTSPPYDSLRTYKGDEWNFEKFKKIAVELYRVTKQGGVVVWVVGDETVKGSESGTSFKQALYFKGIGFNLHDTMIYEKHNFAFASKTRYHQIFEYMFVFSKGAPKTFNPICDKPNKTAGLTTYGVNRKHGKNGLVVSKRRVCRDIGMRTNIFRYITSGAMPNERKWEHPAKFPLQLARDMILSWSKEGDVVLDPFAGAGTTLVAAKDLGRKPVGIEIAKDYCELIKQRMENKL